jgi:hypothetical protein
MDVPNLGFVLRLIGIEQRLELAQIGYVGATQPKVLGDGGQVGLPKIAPNRQSEATPTLPVAR